MDSVTPLHARASKHCFHCMQECINMQDDDNDDGSSDLDESDSDSDEE